MPMPPCPSSSPPPRQYQGLDDAGLASALRKFCRILRRPGLHVVHIASEMTPIAKVGSAGVGQGGR